jgi:hypothetical protein
MRLSSKKLRAASLTMATLLSSVFAVFALGSPAHADPDCNNGGYYVLWVRGSSEKIGDLRADAFYWSLIGSHQNPGVFGPSAAWAELGNLDGDVLKGDEPNNPGEYPAAGGVLGWALLPGYNDSVTIGMQELVTHLNHRYSSWGRNCHSETLVLGGYSQGADVIGWALRRHDLTQAAKNHIGFVALYGDPKFNPGSLSDRINRANFDSNWWWVRGDDTGFRYFNNYPYQNYTTRNSGILAPRDPYVANEFKGRFGSWCAYKDLVCAGHGNAVVHGNYHNIWIPASIGEIVYRARQKRNQLNPSNPVPVPAFTVSMPVGQPAVYETTSSSPNPPAPSIHQVIRTRGISGEAQVYAATKSAVTEAWWRPGGDGVHTSEIIHIAQNNITSIAKVNEPDGVTQALYTAVPDGVWETWWRPGEGIHHAKIVSGLNDVRQVIADPRWEGGKYVHRLYLLAQDGPYEVWWKDGDPSGVHVGRLDQITGAVTMTASTGPSGEYQLYVATPTWVYELWWYPWQGVHHGPIINITQANIDSLSKITLTSGQQRLYTGTSTGVWQSIWHNSTPAHNPEVHGKSGVIHSEVMKTGSAFQAYIATRNSVQEYWWHSNGAGNGSVITRNQGDITTFDKYNDGAAQQVYTATQNGEVYETWWGGGVGPQTNFLFRVSR